ncbi:MAG: AAA family ATPase [Micropruina sp.]|nr:AAA family ATPase [Micropruina sp.]
MALTTFREPLPAGGLERIDQWLTDHPSARLVIVDVLARVRGQTPANANAYDVDYNALTALKRVADQHRVAALVVHHTRKAASEDFLDLVSGTQGLAGAADSVLVLRRDRGGHDAILGVTGRDIEEAEYPLKFAPETCTWHKLDGPVADYRLGDTRRDVLHYLRRHVAATPSEVARGWASPRGQPVDSPPHEQDGQIDSDGRGHYFQPATSATPATGNPTRGLHGLHGFHPETAIA